jgi:hypothetical protein
MADSNIIPINVPGHEFDEVASVLDALHDLAGYFSSPVIRACLEDAVEEIAHLAARGDGQQEKGVRKGAGGAGVEIGSYPAGPRAAPS